MLLALSDADVQLLDHVLRLRLKAMLVELTCADDRAFREEVRHQYERLEAIRELMQRMHDQEAARALTSREQSERIVREISAQTLQDSERLGDDSEPHVLEPYRDSSDKTVLDHPHLRPVR